MIKLTKGNSAVTLTNPKHIREYLDNGWVQVNAKPSKVENKAYKDLTKKQLEQVAKSKGVNSKGKKAVEIVEDIETVDKALPEQTVEAVDDGLIIDTDDKAAK